MSNPSKLVSTRSIILWFIGTSFALFTSPSLFAETSNAKSLFSELKQTVYQIRVIDQGSGDKYTIGSGFLISDQGHIATNFHVVSSYIHDPEKFRLEYVRNDGSIASASLINFDIIRDLAVIQSADKQSQFLTINPTPLDKGDRIYSMGNPHDLGMTIIEGNYNGLLQASRYQKILFSGSLNSGMSGGPAINQDGEVIGINVSTGGDQISFLVPAIYLKQLISQPPLTNDYQAHIEQALLDDQDQFYQPLLAAPFPTSTLGELTIASKISDALKCWGHSTEEDETRYQGFHQHCRSEDETYIESDFFVGDFFYDYEWIKAEEDLNSFQFYSAIEERFTHHDLDNAYYEGSVSNFKCQSDFIEIDQRSWKVSSCFRNYLDYPELFDALHLMVSVDHPEKAMVAKIGASGISQKNAIVLIKRFMESLTWNN
ncbi:serine protease [Litoribacillus peritrichatus]|uniref:Serine protease n=1 Tax=Litoribacillus peritrichatus TaxID=718191 RepID=A0ABP7NF62_9GAMM